MRSIPLSIPNIDKQSVIEKLKDCIDTNWIATGRYISEFEKKVSGYVGAAGAVACQSGTAGLHTALRVLGVEQGDEVIVPALTFIAAVNPVKYLGASPVFMDCDDSLCLDANKLERFCLEDCKYADGMLLDRETGRRVKAIVVVHVFGNLADMASIVRIAGKYNLPVLEDATEALGSYWAEGEHSGKYAGAAGDMGVYSFNANKIISTGGGGMIVSRDPGRLEKARYLATTAKDDDLFFIHDEVGYNYRMLNLQAAIGVSQMEQIEAFIDIKKKNFELYKAVLADLPGLDLLPFGKDIRANHWFYSLIIDDDMADAKRSRRDAVMRALIDEGIQCRPVWRLVCDQKPYLEDRCCSIEKARYYEKHILNIPCSTGLGEDDVAYVAGKIRKIAEKTYCGL
jgi:aminotransferase in exopolysaccharide biosynthesis